VESNDRPPIAIGHVSLRAVDVARAVSFYKELGMRLISQQESMAILELGGGTHLLLFQAKRAPRAGAVRSFDFMVADVAALRARLMKAGVETTEPVEDELSGHQWFQVGAPDGHLLRVYSDHTEGRTV
jgi:catechol 2,3-dioxygenase-like lactoylglutathione lyase family enzyme